MKICDAKNITDLSVCAELFVVFSILSKFGIFLLQINTKKSISNVKMKILAFLVLPSIFSGETRATLEFQLANLSHAGFSGNLAIKIGKGCFPYQDGCSFRKRINILNF